MGFAEKLEAIAEKVYIKGNKDICNALSNFGKRKSFQYAFQYTNFEGITFSETIKPTSAGSVFQWYRGATLPKNIDFSECKFANDVTAEAKVPHKMFFESTSLKKIHDVGLPPQYRYPYTFYRCSNLEEIEIIRNYPETVWSNTFTHCPNLKKVRFSDRIEKSINFGGCNLDLATLEHIILDVLADISLLSASTITISSKSHNRLKNDTRVFYFAVVGEDGEILNEGDYTLLEIVSYKGWNLTVAG